MVLVTHYQRLLDYIVPDFVHVLVNGRIVKSGGPELALELEEKGYSWTEPRTGRASGSFSEIPKRSEGTLLQQDSRGQRLSTPESLEEHRDPSLAKSASSGF